MKKKMLLHSCCGPCSTSVIEKLKERLSVEIFTVDERCSTCEAEDRLIEQGMSREERKQVVDSLAATTILQGFLNDKNKKVNH